MGRPQAFSTPSLQISILKAPSSACKHNQSLESGTHTMCLPQLQAAQNTDPPGAQVQLCDEETVNASNSTLNIQAMGMGSSAEIIACIEIQALLVPHVYSFHYSFLGAA